MNSDGEGAKGNWHEDYQSNRSFGQRASDVVARVMGSWAFVLAWALLVVFWLVYNAIVAKNNAFDAPPYILLNLVLGIPVFFGAPLIMMAQNRQEEKDRRKAERDYQNDETTNDIVKYLKDKLERIEVEKLDYIMDRLDTLFEQMAPDLKKEE
jgi:uncharacterized membrane protein